MLCRSLFVLFLLTIMLSVLLRLMNFVYPFGIFKVLFVLLYFFYPFLSKLNNFCIFVFNLNMSYSHYTMSQQYITLLYVFKKISHHRFSSFIYMLIKGSWYITLLPPSIQETVIGMHVHSQDTNISRVNGDYMMILIHTRNFISALLYLNGTIPVMM